MNNVKKILKAHMALEGITQRDLASVLGITEASLSRKMNGRFEFSDKEKLMIAELFNADISAIFFAKEVHDMKTKVHT